MEIRWTVVLHLLFSIYSCCEISQSNVHGAHRMTSRTFHLSCEMRQLLSKLAADWWEWGQGRRSCLVKWGTYWVNLPPRGLVKWGTYWVNLPPRGLVKWGTYWVNLPPRGLVKWGTYWVNLPPRGLVKWGTYWVNLPPRGLVKWGTYWVNLPPRGLVKWGSYWVSRPLSGGTETKAGGGCLYELSFEPWMLILPLYTTLHP